MAFGIKTQEQREAEKVASGGNRFFQTSTIELGVGLGLRKFRLLPDLKNPSEPEVPIHSYSLWIPVSIDGKTLNDKGKPFKRQIFMDFNTKKELPEYQQMKLLSRYYMNVWDVSPVVVVDTNPEDSDQVQLAYCAPDKKYYIGSGEYRKVVEGTGKPNNRIMILAATKDLRDNLNGLPDVNVDDEGIPLDFLHMTITAAINTGADGKPTPATSAAQAKGDTSFWSYPRWNLNYFRPYPRDAVEALLAGEDYNRVLEEYNIDHNFGKVAVSKDEELPF